MDTFHVDQGTCELRSVINFLRNKTLILLLGYNFMSPILRIEDWAKTWKSHFEPSIITPEKNKTLEIERMLYSYMPFHNISMDGKKHISYIICNVFFLVITKFLHSILIIEKSLWLLKWFTRNLLNIQFTMHIIVRRYWTVKMI